MKILRLLRKHSAVFLAGVVFAVFCFVGINMAMVPVSKSEYCGSKCHEMKTAYKTWELSPHGANRYGISVGCADCHLPSKDKYFTHLVAKAYVGAKDTYKHYFGSEYDVEKIREKVLAHMTNTRCLKCHDNLLLKPGSSAARDVHMEVLNQSDEEEIKCIECHEDTGHQRQSKLFSP